MDLYTYYRSTSSYRLRIALELKELDYHSIPINLAGNLSEQFTPEYRAINPQGRVPALRVELNQVLIQSPAIIEYLEECFPQRPLLPTSPLERARHRGVAALIGCDIHPLHNVSVLSRLRQLHLPETEIDNWIRHWISLGFDAVEALIDDQGFCFGAFGLADVYLLPQVYAARRFAIDLNRYPKIMRVERLALEHPAFQRAHPDAQADKPA
ncbi:MAG TPA: maleylacetoacetate isomerase [Marinobacter sp.]|uniref:Maleylacetoacetate isomerase n=2 Tax=root TaxID=1 RepID=A0A831R7W0_9GAMM|nr:maleylacetoacetate isomerase [Marinobacter antarcticus]HDZ37040.1 maleylacetoacetate isomerase [Marinobacter sp.]HEA53859.1 maleylacetoacetate isomerase [Marinobacter antarcticus]